MKKEPSNIVKEFDFKATGNQRFSRYKGLKRLINEDGDTYIETPNKYSIRESHEDIFYSVEMGYENRLDLISYKFYNTPFLYWVIATVNNINNPFEVPAGIILRIPAMSSIYGLRGGSKA